MPHRVTMADVAQEAGVSLMTVSRVVNNKEGISPSTRQRVQDIIERLGYRPSIIARGLATNRTGTLGLVVPDNTNPFFSEVARGVEHVAYARGYNVFLCNTEEDKWRELAVLRSLEEKRVDGIILCSSRLNDDELRATLARHPAAVLVNRWLDAEGVGILLVDDVLGANMATRHLMQAGHRRIGFLAGPPNSYSSRQRLLGYRTALEDAGLPCDPALIRHALPMVDVGEQTARDLLTDHPDMTALFCFNDLLAVGALHACQHLRRAVPDGLAIVGFDNIPLAALVTPPLTTCHVPRFAIGSQAMELLLAHIDGCAEGCRDIMVQPELIIRASAP